MKIRKHFIGTAVAAAAAGAMFLSAGAANAWTEGEAASVGSGVIEDEQVKITLTNPLEGEITCAYAVYDEAALTTLQEGAALGNEGDVAKAFAKTAEAQEQRLFQSSDGFTAPVASGGVVDKTVDVSEPLAAGYAGVSLCQENDNHANLDFSAFAIEPADDSSDGNGSSNVWGSVENLFPF